MGNVVQTSIFGITIYDHSQDEFIEIIKVFCRYPHPVPKVVCPLNVDIMNQSYENPRLKSIIQSSDLIHVDGAGVIFGSILTSNRLRHKLSTNEIIYPLFEMCQKEGFRVYFLGGPDGQAELAAEVLRKQYPRCKIVGTHRGHLTDEETDEVIAAVNRAQPHILMVGFGSPIQEEWVDAYKDRLHVNVIWSVGAVTSYVSGVSLTAPMWMKRWGLEWIHRFCLDPKRLWKRYVLGNPLFVYRLFKEKWA